VGEIEDLADASEEELALMTKILDKMTKDLDPRLYQDVYKASI
jgi:non-homologous end joining protein Ku